MDQILTTDATEFADDGDAIQEINLHEKTLERRAPYGIKKMMSSGTIAKLHIPGIDGQIGDDTQMLNASPRKSNLSKNQSAITMNHDVTNVFEDEELHDIESVNQSDSTKIEEGIDTIITKNGQSNIDLISDHDIDNQDIQVGSDDHQSAKDHAAYLDDELEEEEPLEELAIDEDDSKSQTVNEDGDEAANGQQQESAPQAIESKPPVTQMLNFDLMKEAIRALVKQQVASQTQKHFMKVSSSVKDLTDKVDSAIDSISNIEESVTSPSNNKFTNGIPKLKLPIAEDQNTRNSMPAKSKSSQRSQNRQSLTLSQLEQPPTPSKQLGLKCPTPIGNTGNKRIMNKQPRATPTPRIGSDSRPPLSTAETPKQKYQVQSMTKTGLYVTAYKFYNENNH